MNSPHSQREVGAVVEPATLGSLGRWRHRKVEVGEDRGDRGAPAAPRARSSARPGCRDAMRSASPSSGVKTVAASGASIDQRGQQAVARLALAAGQPIEPRPGVHPVVALLADELRDELGQRRPRALGERLEPDDVGACRTGSGGRSSSPSHRGRGRAAGNGGTRRARGRRRARRRRCRSARPAGRRARPRGPARPGRASSSRRPPRGAARSRSTPSRRSRSRTRRRPSSGSSSASAVAGRAAVAVTSSVPSAWPGRTARGRPPACRASRSRRAS